MAVVFLLVGCLNKNPLSLGDFKTDSTVYVLSDGDLNHFDVYSNDVLSSFIKDMVLDPIFFYNPTTNTQESRLITNVRWIHDSEVEFTINSEIQFHDSPIFSLGKGRNISPNDFIYSFSLFAKNAKYKSVREFLQTFFKMKPQGVDKLIVSVNKSVDSDEFLRELAACKIPLFPVELREVRKVKNLVGTGLYNVEDAGKNHLFLKVFKNHAFYKSNKKSERIPERYALGFGVNNKELLEKFEHNEADIILTSKVEKLIDYFQTSQKNLGTMISRNEDRVVMFGVNYESHLSSSLADIDFVKSCFNPEKYITSKHLTDEMAGFSNYSLNPSIRLPFDTLQMAFYQIDPIYRQFVENQLKEKEVNYRLSDHLPDCILYSLLVPTNNREQILIEAGRLNAQMGFIDDRKIVADANSVVLQPIKYIVFNHKIKFITTKFEGINDFSCVYKAE